MVVQGLLQSGSNEEIAAELLKLICKAFWSATYMGIPEMLLQQDQFVGWMTCIHSFMDTPVPKVRPTAALPIAHGKQSTPFLANLPQARHTDIASLSWCFVCCQPTAAETFLGTSAKFSILAWKTRSALWVTVLQKQQSYFTAHSISADLPTHTYHDSESLA